MTEDLKKRDKVQVIIPKLHNKYQIITAYTSGENLDENFQYMAIMEKIKVLVKQEVDE